MLNKELKFYKNVEDLKDKSLLITGGTGSFGKSFSEKLIKSFKPKKLIIFSRDEFKQYEMEKELKSLSFKNYRFFIGDVRDCERLKMAFRDIDIVIHAAALKHVPSAEYNPFECIQTNIIGAQNVVTAAIFSGVKKVISLSTDKAASPLNLYGASKLASDKIFVAANNLSGKNGCTFSVVRYGNVINSRGSVIPLFLELKKQKSEFLPITDNKMTRFWITLEQGVEFVLSCLSIMQGGEIFIPKIPSMKITDIADTIAPKMKQKIIGIRPGEKIHEVMITNDDARYTYELDDRFIIFPIQNPKVSRKIENKIKRRGMDKDFKYSSDKNNKWLEKKEFKKLMSFSLLKT